MVVNLSRTDEWIETFGLTILEAMTFGIPVIAPPIGGPTELIDDGYNGFLISSYNIDALEKKITELSKNKSLCMEISNKARLKALSYNINEKSSELFKVLNHTQYK